MSPDGMQFQYLKIHVLHTLWLPKAIYQNFSERNNDLTPEEMLLCYLYVPRDGMLTPKPHALFPEHSWMIIFTVYNFCLHELTFIQCDSTASLNRINRKEKGDTVGYKSWGADMMIPVQQASQKNRSNYNSFLSLLRKILSLHLQLPTHKSSPQPCVFPPIDSDLILGEDLGMSIFRSSPDCTLVNC